MGAADLTDEGREAIRKAVQASALEPEPVDKEPGPFVFGTGRDHVGLPLEHPAYAKTSCRECSYGRGYVTVLLGNGYVKTGPATKRPIRARDRNVCACVHKGYTRVRLDFDRRVEALVGKGMKLDEAMRSVREAVYAKLFPGLDPHAQPSQ